MSSSSGNSSGSSEADQLTSDLNEMAIQSLDLEKEYAKNKTVFGRILRGEEPANFLYQDEQVVAFHDILPIAPVHFLVIPRKTIRQIADVTNEDEQLLGHMLVVATRLAKQLELKKGYRLIINNGQHGCQTVYHLHLHVIGGRQLIYPYA